MRVEPVSSGVALAIAKQLNQPDPPLTEGLKILNAANGNTIKNNT